MNRGLAEQVAAAVDDSVNDLNHVCKAIQPAAADDGQALWRMHVAAVMGALVTHLLAPIWRDHPDLAPPTADTIERDFSLTAEQVQECLRAVTKLRGTLAGLRGHADQALQDSLAPVEARVTALEEYLSYAARRHE